MRLIDDREKEIENFKPDEYWNVDATLGAGHKSFVARLATDANGKKLLPKSEAEARAIEKGLEGASYVVSELKRGKRAKQPTPAFITSTLQQEASRRLGFTATRTMRAAQSSTKAWTLPGTACSGSDHLYAYRQPAHLGRSRGRRQGVYRRGLRRSVYLPR